MNERCRLLLTRDGLLSFGVKNEIRCGWDVFCLHNLDCYGLHKMKGADKLVGQQLICGKFVCVCVES
jgi:hypothetical protein